MTASIQYHDRNDRYFTISGDSPDEVVWLANQFQLLPPESTNANPTPLRIEPLPSITPEPPTEFDYVATSIPLRSTESNALDSITGGEREIPNYENPEDLRNCSELYRLQMAAISTAATGYLKEGDQLKPEYQTPELGQVIELYARYDAAYRMLSNLGFQYDPACYMWRRTEQVEQLRVDPLPGITINPAPTPFNGAFQSSRIPERDEATEQLAETIFAQDAEATEREVLRLRRVNDSLAGALRERDALIKRFGELLQKHGWEPFGKDKQDPVDTLAHWLDTFVKVEATRKEQVAEIERLHKHLGLRGECILVLQNEIYQLKAESRPKTRHGSPNGTGAT